MSMTQKQAATAHERTRTKEIHIVQSMARQMVETEGYDCLYVMQVVKRLTQDGKIDVGTGQKYGGNVFRTDGGYWVMIGTVYAGNRARGTNNSHRGLWCPANSEKYCPKPSEDVLKQGRFDLYHGQPHTKDAKKVMKWLDTEIMIQELNRQIRLEMNS